MGIFDENLQTALPMFVNPTSRQGRGNSYLTSLLNINELQEVSTGHELNKMRWGSSAVRLKRHEVLEVQKHLVSTTRSDTYNAAVRDQLAYALGRTLIDMYHKTW